MQGLIIEHIMWYVREFPWKAAYGPQLKAICGNITKRNFENGLENMN
jgi:hypothetical protein